MTFEYIQPVKVHLFSVTIGEHNYVKMCLHHTKMGIKTTISSEPSSLCTLVLLMNDNRKTQYVLLPFGFCFPVDSVSENEFTGSYFCQALIRQLTLRARRSSWGAGAPGNVKIKALWVFSFSTRVRFLYGGLQFLMSGNQWRASVPPEITTHPWETSSKRLIN